MVTTLPLIVWRSFGCNVQKVIYLFLMVLRQVYLYVNRLLLHVAFRENVYVRYVLVCHMCVFHIAYRMVVI